MYCRLRGRHRHNGQEWQQTTTRNPSNTSNTSNTSSRRLSSIKGSSHPPVLTTIPCPSPFMQRVLMNTRHWECSGMSFMHSTCTETRSDSPVKEEHSTCWHRQGDIGRCSQGGPRYIPQRADIARPHPTLRSVLSMILMSAGTRSPMYNRTRSPGTSSDAATFISLPSRYTEHCGRASGENEKT